MSLQKKDIQTEPKVPKKKRSASSSKKPLGKFYSNRLKRDIWTVVSINLESQSPDNLTIPVVNLLMPQAGVAAGNSDRVSLTLFEYFRLSELIYLGQICKKFYQEAGKQ